MKRMFFGFAISVAIALSSGGVYAQQPAAGRIQIGQGAALPAWLAMTGDCSLASTGAIICLKSNGTAFGTAAFQNTGTSGATIPFLNGANTWSGTNIWSADGYFKSGRPWADVRAYGAVGDGVTDDSAAFANAAAAVIALAGQGGVVYVPPGTYCLFSGFTVNSAVSVNLIGAGWQNEILSVCGHNVALVTLGGGRHSARDLFLLGYNGSNASATSATIHTTSTCVDCLIYHDYIGLGYFGIWNEGVDTEIWTSNVINTYNTAVYDSANAMWLVRSKIDNPWSVSVPAIGASFSSWTNAHAYVVGDVVSSGGFYFQCSQSGTSGGSFPAGPYVYGITIVDNGARWLLATATNAHGLDITTGASETHVLQSDFSGAYGGSSIRIDNDGAGTAPFLTAITDSVVSQSVNNSLNAVAGSGLMLKGNEMAGGLAAGGSTLAFQLAWVGDATVVGNSFISAPNSIFLGAGVNTSIVGNTLGSTAGITVAAGVTDFTISANQPSAKYGGSCSITVAAGASTRYSIVNNNPGCTITNAGTGASQCVSANGTCTHQIIALTSGSGTLAQNSTSFMLGFLPAGGSAEAVASALCPLAGTFKNLYLQSNAPAAGQTLTATWRVNAGDTTITCAITGTGTTCNDTTHTAACTAGQSYTLKLVTSATSGTITSVNGGIEFDNSP